MKIFLDANVLVSVLNKEYPLFTYSSRIVSLAGAGEKKSQPAGKHSFSVSTSGLRLAKGTYVLKLRTDESESFIKLIHE